MEASSRSLLVVNLANAAKPTWRWIEGKVETPTTWRFFGPVRGDETPRPGRGKLVAAALQCGLAARLAEADLVVTHLPRTTAWVAMVMRTLGVRCPHLAFMFNFTDLPTGPRRLAMARAFAHVDRFVVPSSVERDLYAETFGIDRDRIDRLLWGVRPPPEPEPLDDPPLCETPYLAAVGGEGRDYASLLRAMRLIPDVRLEVVCRPHNVEGLEIPPNVHVRTNIPRPEAHNIMRYAKAMVIPLRDATVPCGHGTLVQAMYMGTPLVVSNTRGVADYVRHEDTALLAELGDPHHFAAQLRRLWEDEALGRGLAERARAFVHRECTEQNVCRYFDDFVRAEVLGATPIRDPSRAMGWLPRLRTATSSTWLAS